MSKILKFLIPVFPIIPIVYGILVFLSNETLTGEDTINLLNLIFKITFLLIILQFGFISTLCIYRIAIKRINYGNKKIRIINLINNRKLYALLILTTSLIVITVSSWNIYNVQKHFEEELNSSVQDWNYQNPYRKKKNNKEMINN